MSVSNGQSYILLSKTILDIHIERIYDMILQSKSGLNIHYHTDSFFHNFTKFVYLVYVMKSGSVET
jgi:hypothetical protein